MEEVPWEQSVEYRGGSSVQRIHKYPPCMHGFVSLCFRLSILREPSPSLEN